MDTLFPNGYVKTYNGLFKTFLKLNIFLVLQSYIYL